MNAEWLLAFLAFAFATAGTPGPNNLLLAANAANFGLRRTLGAVFGVSLGFAAMIASVGLGLAWVFEAWPPLATVMKWLGSAWLLYLAWKIFHARPTAMKEEDRAEAASLGFLQMAAFQWVNPKAWSMVLAMMGVHAGQNLGFRADMLLMAGLFALVGTITALSWALLGRLLAHVLSARQMTWLNRLMALLLAASLLPIWL